MPNRRLVLARESLAALDAGELASARGGTIVCPTRDYTECPSCGQPCSFECPTYYC